MIGRSLTALAVTFLVLGSAAERAEAEELSIVSATAVANAILLPYEAEIEALAGVELDIKTVDSGRSLRFLSEGRTRLAAVSAPLADVVTQANRKRAGSVDSQLMMQHDIGRTRIDFVVHPSNPIKDLSFDQITDILAGRITLWSELGGLDMPIALVTEPRGGGIRTIVENTIGKWGDVMTRGETMQSTALVPFAVSKMPNAIGVATHVAVTDKVHVLSSDRVIEQPLFLVTQGEPDPRLTRVIEAVRRIAAGQKAGA